MAVLPGVLGCRPLRRTVQVRLGTNPAVPRDELPGGTPILFALAPLRSVPQAGSQLRGLATAIHEISGLAICFTFILATLHPFPYPTGRILHHRGKVSNILLGSLILARQLTSSLCTVLNPRSIGPVPITFW